MSIYLTSLGAQVVIISIAILSLGPTPAAGLPAPFASTPPAPSRVLSWKVGPLPASKAVGTSPVTLRVEEDEELRKVLSVLASDAGSRITLRLVLVGVEPLSQGKSRYGIKVYVNTPENNPTPRADSIHYVGMVSPFGEKKKGDFAVDLAPTLRKLIAKKLWAPEKPLMVTLVVASLNPKESLTNGEIQLDNIVLESPMQLK